MCRLREELTQHGIKIGWQEGKKDDALKMFKAGYDVSFIARITRLSPDEIEDIIHNA